MSAGCGEVLREVRVCEARPRAPLLRVRRVRAQDGPPLPLGQQLRRLLQLQGEYWPLIGPHTHSVILPSDWSSTSSSSSSTASPTASSWLSLRSSISSASGHSPSEVKVTIKLSLKTEMVYLFLFQVMESSIFCFCFSCPQCSVYLYVRC